MQTDLAPASIESPRTGLWRRIGLGQQILIGMAVGAVLGLIAGERVTVLQPVGELFLRLLVMAAIPLVFFNLLAGITSLTSLGTFGRVGLRISIYYLATTVLALILGLAVMHVIRPGVGVRLTGDAPQQLGEVPAFSAILLDMVPSNVFAAFANGKLTQVVMFALLLGIAVLKLPASARNPLASAFDVLAQALRALVGILLYLAPIGIGALMAVTVNQHGAGLFGPLAKFIGAVWIAQAIMVLVYLALLSLLTPRSPIDFLRKTAPLYATTAATCSSMASLAQAIQVSEERLGLPRSIYSFTLALGATMNQNGTSITLAALLLFTAQAAGVEFSLASQITIVFVGVLLSNGSAGIPGSAVVVALLFVESFNLPVEIAAIVAGVYRLIDMGSTTVNVMGDLVGTVIVADLEGRTPAGK
jgi:Na+/H+-dicarboxylate symporter